MPRVAMLSTFPPMRCGIGDHVREFLPHLVAAGAWVDLVTFDDAHRGGAPPSLEGVRVLPALRASSPPWVVARELRSAARDAEGLLWQSQNFIYPRAFNLAAPLLPRDLPLVTVAHDAPTLSRLVHVAVFLRRLYARSDVIVSHSSLTTEALVERHGVPTEKIVELPLGVDMRTFRADLRDARAKSEMGWSEDDIVVLFLGFINVGKGVHELLEGFAQAAARHPRLRLVLAGDDKAPGSLQTSTGIVDRLKRRAAELGLEDRVTFPGFVAGDRVPTWLASADILALPYQYIFQSAVLSKSMASGGAILATDIPGFSRWLRHEETALLVKPQDAGAIAEALGRLAGDEGLRERLRSAVAAEAARTHDMAAIAQGVLRALEQAKVARAAKREGRKRRTRA